MSQEKEIDEHDEYGLRKEKWELYKPKKYYTRPKDEYTLQQNLDKVEKVLESLPYHEDIPRCTFRVTEVSRGIDLYEESIWCWTIHGFLIGKAFCNRMYVIKVWTLPQNQPQNRGVYEDLPFETRIRNHLDYQYDLYRNVEKIKYTDNYVSKKERSDLAKWRVRQEDKIRREFYKKHNFF